ncbi:MAG TPA: glycosyltransferase [Myxococcota bacterium]|nr:glycosyltransferase [Myxococcota bacterium]
MAPPSAVEAPAPGTPPTLRWRYLLVTAVPYHQGADGRVLVDRLWQHDLTAHLAYLPDFTLAAPRVAEPAPGWVPVEVPAGARLSTCALPEMRGARDALVRLPRLVAALWRGVRRAELVHSGVAGWPFPPAWVANPMALALGRRLFLVVESAPWRLEGRARTGFRARLRAAVSEWLARFFVNRAGLVLVTQPEYRAQLFTRGRGTCLVAPAVWIDDGDVLSRAAAEGAWAERRAGPLRVLFASRLVAGKGVRVLLEALRVLEARGAELEVTVLGEGPEAAAVEQAARELRHVQLWLEAPVAYGPSFFARVDAHHVVVVPNLGDEQPRIVFDAFARALPVVASETAGLAPHVHPGENGWLVPPGDAAALAEALDTCRANRAALETRGLAGLRSVARHTHRAMHAQRAHLLAETFGAGPAA